MQGSKNPEEPSVVKKEVKSKDHKKEQHLQPIIIKVTVTVTQSYFTENSFSNSETLCTLSSVCVRAHTRECTDTWLSGCNTETVGGPLAGLQVILHRAVCPALQPCMEYLQLSWKNTWIILGQNPPSSRGIGPWCCSPTSWWLQVEPFFFFNSSSALELLLKQTKFGKLKVMIKKKIEFTFCVFYATVERR